MKYCHRLKKKVYNKDCQICIFNYRTKKICTYKFWYPGLKNTDIEQMGK